MRSIALAVIVVASLAPSARAAPICLPAAVARAGTEVHVGTLAGVPILCAARDGQPLGCWDIDPKSGKLAAREITALPGRSIKAVPDAKRCVDGYCLPAVGTAAEHVLMATSTDGQHVVIGGWNAGSAAVFDAKTKKLLRTFEFSGDTDDTIIGNVIVGLLYIGNTIYARGADAGPNEVVFAIKDDGTRLGHVGDGQDPAFSIYEGSASALDAERLALTDPYFKHLVIISAKDNSRTVIRRPFSLGPCGDEDFDAGMSPRPKCRKHFAKTFAAYSGAELVALANGDLLIALSATFVGQVAILDGKRLVEKRRLRPPICRK